MSANNMSADPVALVQSVYAAFGRGDVAFILAQFHADATWDVVGPTGAFPTFGHRKGLKEIGGFFETLAANETFSEFVPEAFDASGDKVFVTGRCASKLTKTGRTYSSDWIHIWTFKGGKIASFKEFFDSAAIAAAYRS